MRLKISLAFIASILFIQGHAQQIRSFSEDPAEYLGQVQELLIEADKKLGEEIFNDFNGFWNSGSLTDSMKTLVIEASNAMLKKRQKPIPEFQYFFESLRNASQKIDQDQVQNYIKGVREVASGNSVGKTKEFIEVTHLFFKNNSLYESNSSRWFYQGGEVKFVADAKRPYFLFEKTNLKAKARGDSSLVEETNGAYYPIDEEFIGKGGTIFWSRAGYDKDSAYAELQNYTVPLSKIVFEADSVTLYSQYYVQEPLLGKLEEKLTARNAGDEAIYPKFESYNKMVALKIADEVNFMGGFVMEGARFRGYGTVDNKAQLVFEREGKVLVRVASTSFLLRRDRISTADAHAYLYLEEDSIFHPKLNIRFTIEDRLLTLNRENEGLSKTPFFNTYHKVDMYFGQLTWKMGEAQMTLSQGITSNVEPVVFESNDYFTTEKYDALQGMDRRHPIYVLAQMVKQYDGRREFSIDLVAEYFKMTDFQAKRMMMNMSIFGYADYELETHTVTISDRVFSFIEAKKGDRDYDVIQFVSRIAQKENATLSLLDYNMSMNGVGRILLSDSQDVVIYPFDQEIVLKKNRDFDFAGRVKAGRFDMYGFDFHFIYDNFFLNLNQIDSMRFKVPAFEANAQGDYPLKRVTTPLRDLSGVLYIDAPQNKSGKDPYSEFPIFKSGSDTYVYYDYDYIYQGAYRKEDFYFHVDPFELDSLDNFETAGLAFTGELNSAGIFEPLRQSLTVQPDYSLGFDIELPPGGFAAYGGKGNFDNRLSLSNSGLVGDGVISYITSESASNAFTFFPDSVRGLAHRFEVSKQNAAIAFPPASGSQDEIRWLPYSDQLHSANTQDPFDIFEAEYKHFGTLTVTPQGLLGDGLLQFETAETESKDYVFGYNSFKSEHTAFWLDRFETGEWTITITDAKANVDFDRRNGKFVLNDKDDYISFPVNQYICLMDVIDWDMDKRLIDIKNSSGADYSPLVSVNPAQDSLQFVAGRARYVMEDYFLEAFEVKQIDVADAGIQPKDEYVAIEKEAYMRPFTGSKIVANRNDKWHEVYEADIQVYSRNNYGAEGDYDYLDESKKAWTIHFDTIGVENKTSFAFGSVAEEDDFFLSPFFAYNGNVRMYGNKEFLQLTGSTHIQSTCTEVRTDWIPFKGEADPKDITIDLRAIGKMGEKDTLWAAMVWAGDSAAHYTAFMGKITGPKDHAFFTSNGVLWYDKNSNEYKITTKEKKLNPDLPDQYLAFNNRNCTVEGRGRLDFGGRTGMVKVDPIGLVSHNTRTGTTNLEISMGVDFLFSEDALQVIANDFYNEPMLAGTDLENENFQMAVRTWIEKEKDADKYLEDLSVYGTVRKLPKELVKPLIFTELSMEFKPEFNAFVSKGDFGLVNLGENQMNLVIDGKIAYEKGRSSDELLMYLEANPSSNWYFFNYDRNRMQAMGANDQFDAILKELSQGKRTMENPNGPNYFYMAGTSKRNLTRFLDR